LRALCFTLVLVCLSAAVRGTCAEKPVYLSPVAIAADRGGMTLYIAEETARSVAVFDIPSGKVVRTFTVPEQPNGVALSPDGSRLYVTCNSPDGTVAVIDTKSGSLVQTIAAGHTPCCPVMNRKGDFLYVCNRFEKSVAVIDCARGKAAHSIPMLREPIASVLTPDDKHLFTVNHLPTGELITDYVREGIMRIGTYVPSSEFYTSSREKYAASCVVLVASTSNSELEELIMLPPGSTGAKGICISPDGRYVYVTHILARYQLPTSQLDRGWMNTNALSIIDAVKMKYVTTVLLDDLDCGGANPWGVVCSPDGANLCVAHAGSHEISIIDRAALHERIDRVARGEDVPCVARTIEKIPNDLTFLVGLRRRVPLDGKGPRGIACAGAAVYAAEYFSDSVGIVPLASGGGDARSVALGPARPMTPERAGEMYFNDAGICFQHWQSCASCHPDARMDGLSWDLLNDGVGNPKNTKSLLLSHMTPPVMITGIRKDAETAVRAGMKFIQFSMPDESAAAAIDAYLRSLEPVPSPALEQGKPSRDALRGKEVFEQAGCAKCHSQPLLTDMKKYDVGTGTGRERGLAFDTPTLVELWRTAPYLYDGRTDAMKSVLSEYNPDDMHGATSKLNYLEMYFLLEYLLSL
jgi:YVTN family beta-propeller protein